MASENSALWGSLVKAMTRKIEVPGFAPPPRRDDYRPAPHLDPGPAGRRASDGRAPLPPEPPVATVQSPDQAIERIAAHLSYLTRATVEQYLDAHGHAAGPLGRRLAALGLVEPGTQGSGAFWWSVLSTGVVDPETFAELLRPCPGVPQRSERSGLLFDFVLDSEVGSYREVKAADKKALAEGRRLVEVLAENGTLSEARAADVLAEFFGHRRKRGKKWGPDATLGHTITPEIARAFEIVPVSGGGDSDTVHLLSTTDPGTALTETLKKMTGHEVEVLIDTPEGFSATLKAWEAEIEESRAKARASQPTSRAVGAPKSKRKRPQRRGTGEFRIDQDSFVGINSPPEMARALMERATSVGATDIHLEPQRDGMRARFRLDGILYDVTRLRGLMGEEVLSRVKVMADMDITERRKPQDGHIRLELMGDNFDFRIATVPTTHGERMSIRITAGAKEVPTLELLSLEEQEDKLLHDFTRRSHGIVLACGPVGSGKTTTLYASLGEVDASAKNIMTIEDPVEIALNDVSQINVNYKIGLDFATGLRALMRQDPNIILVGEVRDEETAKVAVRASLTGLLVFTTIHANSAAGAITTLYNFKIPPFLLATSLVGVVSQRLLRTICPDCREEHVPEPKILAQTGITDEWLIANGYLEAPEAEPEPAPEVPADEKPKRRRRAKKKLPVRPSFFRGAGCDSCFGTGHLGRRGIFEILDVTEEMRLAISEQMPESALREMALAGGMRSLADSGRHKVVTGETTLDEFIRVLYQ